MTLEKAALIVSICKQAGQTEEQCINVLHKQGASYNFARYCIATIKRLSLS